MAGNSSDSEDQLEDFIHAYSYAEYELEPHPSSDEDASYSESGSEPPEDPAAEAEDMAFYDLYDDSARPSPQPPPNLLLPDTILEEADATPDNTRPGEKCQPSESRNCACVSPDSLALPRHISNGCNHPAGCSSESDFDSGEESEESKE